jgi:hypothetical protein
MQVDASAHVTCWPSIEQPQPNCEHHACWLLAIVLYASESVVTRVPVDAQAVNTAHTAIANRLRQEIRFMIRHLSLSMASDAPGFSREESTLIREEVRDAVRGGSDYFRASTAAVDRHCRVVHEIRHAA